MAAAPDRLLELLGFTADLYKLEVLSPASSQAELIRRLVAADMAEWDRDVAKSDLASGAGLAPALPTGAGLAQALKDWNRQDAEDRSKTNTKQFFQRTKPSEFWKKLLKHSKLAGDDPLFVKLSARRMIELEAALGGDRTFWQVAQDLKVAARAEDPAARLAPLVSASTGLTVITGRRPAKEPGKPPVTASRVERWERLGRASACWAEVFDLALADDEVGAGAEAVARVAVVQGHLCARKADRLRPRPAMGEDLRRLRDRDKPSVVDGDWLGLDARWVLAMAVLLIRTGTQVSQVVGLTREWSVKHVGKGGGEVSEVDLLTQAGLTLLRSGRRVPAGVAWQAAWRASGKDRPSSALMGLGLQLAGVFFAHGEVKAAKRFLPARMGKALEAGPVGGEDPSWYDLGVPYWLYGGLVSALKDPAESVVVFRAGWVRAFARIDAWPLSLWLFGGMFTQLLIQCGDPVSAATVARGSLRELDDPVDAGERQIKAHLSEISVAGKAPKPDQVARVRALADELSAIVLSAPGVLADAEDFRFLEGVLLVARAERWGSRIVPKKQDSS